MSDWWRVQAVWTVEGEPRIYRPVYYDGRATADAAAADIAQTLSHFPTLEVRVTRATAEEVEADRLEREKALQPALPVVHLMLPDGGETTACGVEGNSVSLDLWRLSTATKCAACDEIAKS